MPLAAALVLVNGLRPGPLLLAAGALVLAAGLAFRVPFPVQPLKALTALAVAQRLDAEVIHAAGLLMGVLLVLLSLTGLADRLAVVFTKPVIRSLQLGVGSLLVVSALRLVQDPPGLFASTPPAPWTLVLAAATLAVVAVAAHRRWYALTGLILAGGVASSWLTAPPELGSVAVDVPTVGLPPASLFATAFVVLVVPQIPLTYGNAVVGVSDLAREHFGDRAARVRPGRVALSCGLGNLGAALVGGMPMCHGSSGFSAHVRLGARSTAMNVLLGGAFVLLGLVFADQVLALFGLLPVWALAGFLAYAGLRHAALVLDLRGRPLAVAAVAGAAGLATGSLVWTTAIALAGEHAGRVGARLAPIR